MGPLLLFQLDTLLFFFLHLQFFYSFSLHVSDRLVHHQENQITLAASGTFPLVLFCGEVSPKGLSYISPQNRTKGNVPDAASVI